MYGNIPLRMKMEEAAWKVVYTEGCVVQRNALGLVVRKVVYIEGYFLRRCYSVIV